jgi:predicted phosphodiesterase
VPTLVVSDLHLGTRAGVDVLRRATVLDAFLDALAGADRLVLLGDTLELRQRGVGEVLASAEPVLRAIGERFAGRPVLLVPGNHDHALIAPWLHRREGPLGLEGRCAPAEASHAAARVAAMLAPAQVELAYPGVWLRDGIYATHGHYLDLHMTVPTLERLVVAASGRITLDGRQRWDDVQRPGDYEAVIGPPYAWIDAAAQSERASQVVIGGRTVGAWNTLRPRRGGRRPLRARALVAAFPLAVRALNAAGLGPLRSELSVGELRRSGLRAISEVVERLQIEADHVIFGHTHRAGPLPGDEPAEWLTPNGVRLHNTGSWSYSETFSRDPGSPYWPGMTILVEDSGPPRPQALLADREARELAPAP